MEKVKGKKASLFMCATVAAFFTHNLVIPVMSSANYEDKKNYYYSPPNPYVGQTPPTVSQPSPPKSNDGGYYNSPPTVSQPSPPKNSEGRYHGGPPSTPSTSPSAPSPPSYPHTPLLGTFNFWKTHLRLIWGLLGGLNTIGSLFAVSSVPGLGAHISLLEALSNTLVDGFGALYREGTAALLNSVVNKNFPYTTNDVRAYFVTALKSEKAATTQAHLFKLANEGKLNFRA